MIGTCVIWKGGNVASYQDELDAWMAETLERYPTEPARFDLEVYQPDNDDLAQLLSDDSYWMEEFKVVTLDRIDTWKAPDVNALIADLEKQETIYHLSIIYRSKDVIKSVEKVTTEEIRYRLVPYDLADLSEWVIEWLGKRDTRISRDAAEQVAEHYQEDLTAVVSLCLTLSKLSLGRTLTWADVQPHLGEMGVVEMFALTKAIVAGDKARALEVLARLLPSFHPLQMLGLLSKKYRQYLMCVDSSYSVDDLAAIAGGSPGALRYAASEARQLGKSRCILSFNLIVATERGVKGENALEDGLAMQLLVIRLAQHFSLASGARLSASDAHR